MVLCSLADHGGEGRVWPPASTCGEGVVGGGFQDLELIHDDGILGSVILCPHGGGNSISSEEAFHL
jgi:hypothetical protein